MGGGVSDRARDREWTEKWAIEWGSGRVNRGEASEWRSGLLYGEVSE
jgi:hypothetical protein